MSGLLSCRSSFCSASSWQLAVYISVNGGCDLSRKHTRSISFFFCFRCQSLFYFWREKTKKKRDFAHSCLVLVLPVEGTHVLSGDIITEAGDQPSVAPIMWVKPLPEPLRSDGQRHLLSRRNRLFQQRPVVQNIGRHQCHRLATQHRLRQLVDKEQFVLIKGETLSNQLGAFPKDLIKRKLSVHKKKKH